MIRPHLEYVDFVVEPGSKSLVSNIDRLQERALRRIEFCISTENKKTYIELGSKYGIEHLHIRMKRSLLNLMYRPTQCKDEFNVVQDTGDFLRSNKKVKMKYKFSRLAKLYNSPYYKGVKLWNILPDYIQNCK